MNAIGKVFTGFGRFVVDFFVGDTPELFWSALGILVAVGLGSRGLGLHRLSAVLLPLGVAAALSLSLWRARRRSQ
jgi:hypothetical protein